MDRYNKAMNLKDPSITALLIGAVSISAVHALIPSHWFSFAVVGRAQKWTYRQTLMVTALAGLGHVLLTIFIGLLIAGFGKSVLSRIPAQAEHIGTCVALGGLGVYFLWQSLKSKGCHHGHHHDEEENSPHNLNRFGPAPKAMAVLALGMTLSPCLDLLSIYVAAAPKPWSVVLAISLVMAFCTVGMMLILVSMALHGLKRVKLDWLEKYEGQVVGVVLIVLAAIMFLV